MTNDEVATKLTEVMLMMAQEQAARHGTPDKTEFNPQELLVAAIGVATGMVSLIAHLSAQTAGAVDGGASLHPAYFRYIGTALFNGARDAEVSVRSIARQRQSAGDGSDARSN